ncbi:hypothetical protein CBS101457_005088 [Exobasidium rhododendri]|nr:hypothetical protein CBS101457_005088 [Exobasidium rhododendri]
MSSPILNPNSKYAHLPPDIANQTQAVELVLVTVLGFYGWEILTGLTFDYFMLLRAFGVHVGPKTANSSLSALSRSAPQSTSSRVFSILVAIVYLVTRYSSLIYAAVFTAFLLQKHTDCEVWQIGAALPAPFAVITPTLLLYFRLIAISGFKLWSVVGVGIIWVGEVIAAFFILPASIGHGVAIAETGYCTIGGFGIQGQAQTIYTLFLNTILFIAISLCVLRLQNASDGSPTSTVKKAFKQNLPSLSQLLLADGLFYYIIAVVTNLINVIFVFSPSIAPALRLMWTVPNSTITSAMVCRITRTLIENGSGAISSRMSRKTRFSQNRPNRKEEIESDNAMGSGRLATDTPSSNSHNGKSTFASFNSGPSPIVNYKDTNFASSNRADLGEMGLPSLSVTGSLREEILAPSSVVTMQTETFQAVSRSDKYN